MLRPGKRESAVNWPLWLGAGLLSCAILGTAVGFQYWRRAKLEARAVAPEVPQRLEPVPAELRPLINHLALPFATDGIDSTEPNPTVLIDRSAIYVGVKKVGNVEPLQQSGRMQRVDDLFNTLKDQRESWKAANPGQEFDGVVEYWIDENTSALVVKDVFQTAAFAGFPNGHFAARSRSMPLRVVMVPADARVPRPPGIADPNQPTRVLAARLGANDLVELAWVGEGLDARERSVALQDVGSATKELWNARPPVIARDTGTPKYEEAILLVPNEAPFRKLIQLLDGLYQAPMGAPPGKCDGCPAFEATLRVNLPDRSARELAEDYLNPNKPATPRIRLGATAVSGRLAPDVIQKTVRASFGAMQSCYLYGLAQNPQLSGRVNIRFVIARDGKVSRAEASPESTLLDHAVQSCIVHAFTNLKFPPPEGGIVTVVYPIVLEPG